MSGDRRFACLRMCYYVTSENKPEKQGPDSTEPETTLREDFDKVVDKGKRMLSPKTMATEAGATALGLDGALDALKTGKGGAEAQKELAEDEKRAESAADGGPAAKPAGKSLYAMDDGSGGTADGGMGGPTAAGSAPDAGFGASAPGKRQKTGKNDEEEDGKPGGGKAAKLHGGAAKGLDLAGKRVGVGNAGKFVRGSDSDGSRTGDAKSVASGASDGAKIGAAIGGVGAVPGALIGGALQGMKTKRGRRTVVAMSLLPALPLILIFGIAALLVVGMLASASTIGATSTQNSGTSIEVVAADGVPYEEQSAYQDSASFAHVPWEILAAIVHVQGTKPSAEEQPSLSKQEARRAIDGDSPIGPFKILAGQAVKVADELNVEVDIPALTDLRPSSDYTASVLHSLLNEEVVGTSIEERIETFDLDVGTVVGTKEGDEESDGDQARYIDGVDPSGNDLGFDGYAAGGGSEHAMLRDVFIAAISRLPIASASTEASRIFDIAMMWHLGRTVQCNVNTASATPVQGGWANPLMGPISSRYGLRFHPVRLVTSLHDGTDIAQSTGTPVYAASSGTVTVGGPDAGWGGAHTVLIDHGNGIKTVYGHLSAHDVESGATVSAGQVIGKVGSLGYSTGPHLHFTVRHNDEPIDPEPFLKERGIDLGVTPSDQIVEGGNNTSSGSASAPEAVPTSGNAGQLPAAWTTKNAHGEEITLERAQLAYAAAIAAKASELGLPADAAVIALMTVFVESGFKMYANDGVYSVLRDYALGSAEQARAALDVAKQSLSLPHDAVGTDHDSVGLFQQRNSWGPVADRMDAAKSAGFFYERLKANAGWDAMAKGNAAQAVQVSAFPDRYAAWETSATELAALVNGVEPGSEDACNGMSGTSVDGYTIATFNILGWNHTEGRRARKGFAGGDVRFPAAMEALDTAGVSIAMLQEMHPQNQKMFRERYSNDWDSAQGEQDYVVWRKSEWKAVQVRQVKIPYFGGQPRNQPFVLLEQVATGEKVWVMGIHNPADAAGPARHHRAESLKIEKEAISAVKGDGYPVFIGGDFNDWRDGATRAQCILTPMMTSVFGTGDGPCGLSPKDNTVNRIFSLNAPAVGEAQHHESTRTERISDHAMVSVVVGQSSASGSKAVAWAMGQKGKGYSQAQDLRLGPTHYDCSGLVHMAWKHAGVEIPTTSITQSTFGKQISRDELQPGDLIFYRSPVSHVSMYIGERNGTPMMVHAANPRKGVEVVPLSYMAAEEVGYRRVAE